MNTLIFIDTNIFLDFYRVKSREGGLSVLKHIDENHDQIITTYQVEIEFKKNRQSVIMDSLRAFKAPDWNSLSVPAFLSDAKPAKALATGKAWIDRQHEKARERITRVFNDPLRTDPVYGSLQRLFRSTGCSHHLKGDSKERRIIERLALKRFLLGHPPRKQGDTSYGDAINWEWIVSCASATACEIVIVTRDNDFGITFGKDMILNDWLHQEFKDRVSRKRKITLTNRLTDALKRSKIKVTPEEIKGEEELVKSGPHRSTTFETTLGPTGVSGVDLKTLLGGGVNPGLSALQAQIDELANRAWYKGPLLPDTTQYETMSKAVQEMIDSLGGASRLEHLANQHSAVAEAIKAQLESAAAMNPVWAPKTDPPEEK